MASVAEIRVWQKMHLVSLLKVKQSVGDDKILQEQLKILVCVMEQEDVAYCEKIIGTKAL